MRRLRGNRIEPLWLAITGAGLRREEALGLRIEDLQFEPVALMDGSDGWVCRALVHEAVTQQDGRKTTKTCRTRWATICEPFAGRLREVTSAMGPGSLMRRIDGRDMAVSSMSQH